MGRGVPAFGACGLHLFVAVFLLADLALGAALGPVPGLPVPHLAGGLPATAFALFYPVHLGVSLYDGRFGGARTATWLLLALALVGNVAAGFLAYVLPWGQLAYWAAAQFARLGLDPGLLAWVPDASAVFAALPLGLLALDALVLHARTWRGAPARPGGVRPARAALLAASAAVAAAAAAAAAIRAFPPVPVAPEANPLMGGGLLTPARIVPEWPLLPYYALLRAVPSKLGGLALVAAALLLPAAWPWLRADRARTGAARRPYLALCLGAALAWIALGWSGAQPPEDGVVFVARLAAATLASFPIAVAVLGRRAAPAPRGGRAAG